MNNGNEVTYRVKFTKGEPVKYIGHLDVMRLFQRAIRRAGLKVAFSKGFNPHQLLAFANPLSLGMTSSGEYGDFTMAEAVPEQVLMDRLNETLPEGVRVLSVVRLKPGADKAMASVAAARYMVELTEDVTPAHIKRYLAAFLAREEIVAMKKTKKNNQPTNIRPDIFGMEDLSEGERARVGLFLAAGSLRNVKAQLVMECFYDYMGKKLDWFSCKCLRQELYRLEDERLLPLNQGNVIEEF